MLLCLEWEMGACVKHLCFSVFTPASSFKIWSILVGNPQRFGKSGSSVDPLS